MSDGFVPVPPKPTPEMLDAILPTVRALVNCDTARANEVVQAVYALAVETAPSPPGERLTDDQHAVLVAIDKFKKADGRVPSHRMIADEVGFSRPKVSYVISRLAAMKYIKPARRRKRADGQNYTKKFAYTLAIRPDPYR